MAKQIFSAKQVEDALCKARGLVSVAARNLGCDDQTVRNYATRYPSVQKAIEDSRATLVDSAEQRLAEAVEQKAEPWAIALVLRTLGRSRGYYEKSEIDGNINVLMKRIEEQLSRPIPIDVHRRLTGTDDE